MSTNPSNILTADEAYNLDDDLLFGTVLGVGSTLEEPTS
jgi:hypothetical protein